MTTLVAGASGATGKQVVAQLLGMGQKVRVIVRPSAMVPATWNNHDSVSVVRGSILEFDVREMANHVKGCHAIACCLGHNLTLKGVFGKPRRLVTDAVRLLCAAIKKNSPQSPVRLVLMNTAGNRNRNLTEPDSAGQRVAMSLIRLLLPPQADNEQAADFLRLDIGQRDALIEWAVVRPDTLVDQGTVTMYEVYGSPVRSAIFNPGKTSRINVGHFMARLAVEDELWDLWKGKMPVIYDKG